MSNDAYMGCYEKLLSLLSCGYSPTSMGIQNININMKKSNFITKDRNPSKHIRKLSSPENDGCISLDGDVMGIPLKQWR